MAANEVVTAVVREGKFNKNAARRVRVAGKLPGVVYGAKEAAVAVELDPKQMLRILHSDTGHNTIFDLDVAGAKAKAMIVDWQFEPIRDRLIHVDLKRIALDVAMHAEVPVVLVGTAFGVKNEGGLLDQVLREVEIECLPGDIPSSIEVDVTHLKVGDVIRVADLPHGGKFKFITDEDATVAHLAIVKEDEATADALAAAAEPEVAKKGKGDEAAAPAAPAKK
ncbi:50S ribosomal protein L25 [Acidipila sp. EB88]|uniref:50S ribosomal protein L25 n=1 Tax=Acidipila sp. EB88 TaxID=2305226 RepID=UPI000F5EBD94|nr:50S ribosomal protein L25 [Acidipila sp. EB88]RRA48396.1 50S ribosomal protein L25 [Acidipila sp. EB88]